jgi:hypothetical protein
MHFAHAISFDDLLSLRCDRPHATHAPDYVAGGPSIETSISPEDGFESTTAISPHMVLRVFRGVANLFFYLPGNLHSFEH